MNKFRLLKAKEISCRVNQINEKGLTLLLYKDARVDMDILDETVGCMNWQREHKELKGNIYCGVSIFDGKQWATKWDSGSESNTEAEKGEASDSFKRACVNWGIGRELYTAPFIWIKAEDAGIYQKGQKYASRETFRVETIHYNKNREIDGLSIKNSKNKRVYLKMPPEEVKDENNKQA